MSRKKELFIKAAAKFGTPILVYDSSVFQSCYSNLREALPPYVDIFYVFKSKSKPITGQNIKCFRFKC